MLIAVSAKGLAPPKAAAMLAAKATQPDVTLALLGKGCVLIDREMIQAVWEKGQVVLGQDSQGWRKDQCGAWIGREFYGNRESEYGWEIDQIDPKGSDDFVNLRPLQWRNDMDKSDGPLKCTVTAMDQHNVESKRREAGVNRGR